LLGRDFGNFEDGLWREEHIVVPKTPPHSFFPRQRLPIYGNAYRDQVLPPLVQEKNATQQSKNTLLVWKDKGPGQYASQHNKYRDHEFDDSERVYRRVLPKNQEKQDGRSKQEDKEIFQWTGDYSGSYAEQNKR
jgi:hypothetical protein